MTLDDLRTLHEAMPPGSAISLSREALGELLGELIQPDADVRKVWDLTPPRGGPQRRLGAVDGQSVVRRRRPRIPLLSD